jgi:hypothetical protein
MKYANNMAELEMMLQKKINSALEQEVSEEVKETMSEVIQNETFRQYTPTQYQRREEYGEKGLSSVENMEAWMLDNKTIVIRNMTTGNERYANTEGWDQGLIDEIIVSGDGYHWTKSEIYNSPIARDFYAETAEELRNTGRATHALYRGLKRQNLDVRSR